MNVFFSRHAERIEPELNSGCWLWNGAAQQPEGYGLVWWNGRSRGAHRAAYEAINGPDSARGLMVRHKCDTPACVNPAHLELGTNDDNMRDRAERGRAARGSRNHKTKLNAASAIAIRERYAPRHPQNGARALGREFGVDLATIRDILRRRTWVHV